MGYTTFQKQKVWVEPTKDVDRLAAAICMSAVDDLKRYKKNHDKYKPEYDRVCSDIKALDNKIKTLSVLSITDKTKIQLYNLKEKRSRLLHAAKLYEKDIFAYESARDFIKSPMFEIYANIDGDRAINILEGK